MLEAIIALGIVVLVLLIILLLIFVALPLYITGRFLDVDKGILTALGTTILLIITFIGCLILVPFPIIGLLVAIFVNLLLIKVIYDISWGEAFVMWIVAIIMAIIIFALVFIISGIGLLALIALA